MSFLRAPRPTSFNTWYVRSGKAWLDRCAAAVLLVTTAPLMLQVALLVRLALGPGVFFVQPRAGLHRRPFRCLKFRTMQPDRRIVTRPWPGPERRSGLPSADDPRHTRFGTLLRRFSLDELPQLLNVLWGDMSLVGPRPELLELAAGYDERQRLRFSVKPGLTGCWQVTHRGDDVDLRRFAELDIEYAQTVSPANDLRILLRTPLAALSHPAATERRTSRLA